MGNEVSKPWYKKPLVLISIGTGFVGLCGLGYYIYTRSRNSASQSTAKAEGGFDSGVSENRVAELPSPDFSVPAPTYSPSPSGGFPLQKGSRGELVANLQRALINKFGTIVLPKWGADGVWGSELTTALASKGLKTVIDNATYSNYVMGNFGSSGSSSTPKTTANTSIVRDIVKSVVPSFVTDPNIKIGFQLFDTAKAKNIGATLQLLTKLKNTNDYSSASQGFQMRPYEPPFRTYTLVTGLLDAFKDSADNKAKLRTEFRRMGLRETVKNSDPANYESTWTLSGLGAANKNVRTTMKAIITDGFNIRVEVPARTVIGRWVSSGNGYTRFRTFDGRAMYVRTNAVVLVD
jgi:hypothetical protein